MSVSEPPSKKSKQDSPSTNLNDEETTNLDSKKKKVVFNNARVTQLAGPVKTLNPGSCSTVAYYMHRDQRVQDNWAMLFAQSLALHHATPLHVVCMITSGHPRDRGATLRHLTFCFEGLKEVAEELKSLNIPFHLLVDQGGDNPGSNIVSWMEQVGVDCLVTDFSPLRQHRGIVNQLVEGLGSDTKKNVYQVDAHNIVPLRVTSEKQEYAARTIRNKIMSQLPKFLTEFPDVVTHPHGDCRNTTRFFAGKSDKGDIENWDEVLESLKLDRTVLPSPLFKGGRTAGQACLESFVKSRIKQYSDKRNDPNVDALSHLSPWFHMGNLSAQRAVLHVKKHASSHASVFVEEAVVRRELSDNFCFYNEKYDSVEGASSWAQTTLGDHSKDKREYVYSREELESGKTHDDLWNAAQRQLTSEGKMHGFMRMYWAKKILEWTESPEVALDEALYLNDHFSLDGSDANGFVGCMWSICGIHDQGWKEREVFGKIRFMNYNGCKRKFDISKYISKYSVKSADIRKFGKEK